MYTNPTTLSMNNVVNISQSYFFKPIHTFVIEPITQRPEGAEQDKKDDSVHFAHFLELDNIFTKPQSIRHAMYIAPPKSSMMIAIHIVESSVRFRRMVYEGGAKAGAECSCV